MATHKLLLIYTAVLALTNSLGEAARLPLSALGQERLSSLRLLAEDNGGAPAPSAESKAALPGGTFLPMGGKGSWEPGGSTGCIMIHANLMRDGRVIGWGSTDTDQSQGMFPSSIYDPKAKAFEPLLGDCGIHDCKNAFCSGQVTTKSDEVLIFGGHGDEPTDLRWFRRYENSNRSVSRQRMSSARWYPTPLTLPDGRVLVIGGVPDPGDAGYDGITRAPDADPALDNPSYEIYDPATDSFSGDKWDMQDQLSAAHPINTYPVAVLLPDGGLAVSSGKLLVRYDQAGHERWKKSFSYESRPGPPWSYPQTGAGIPLPMHPPYDRLELLAAGGTSEDYATQETPASAAAHVIDLTAGEAAMWQRVGSMPHRRVMGDAVVLCDGTIGIFNGAGAGLAGWNEDESMTYDFKDGTSLYCDERCSSASDPVYEPVIFDPATRSWSARGSLAEMARPRMYHSVALLLPDCRVMVAGSDVTYDGTAEIFFPPYLSLGPRPAITAAPAAMRPGDVLRLGYTSTDPVDRVLLLRTGAFTHSMPFDSRALWLLITSNVNGTLSVRTPVSGNKLPPGLYMLVALTTRGVPSAGRIISVDVAPAAPPPAASP